MKNLPPPVLDSANVLAFAYVDESVTYIERETLFVNGALLGAVPQLAICQNPDENEVMVFHCNAEWQVLGVAAYSSIPVAMQKIERSYQGLAKKWVTLKIA